MSEVVLKITHTKYPVSSLVPPIHVNTFVDAIELSSVHTKEALIQLLHDKSVDISLSNAPYITVMRKSKKNNKYITLENYDDFRALHRSLRVKNHVKLAISDHSPGRPAETGYSEILLTRIKEYVDKIEEVAKRIAEASQEGPSTFVAPSPPVAPQVANPPVAPSAPPYIVPPSFVPPSPPVAPRVPNPSVAPSAPPYIAPPSYIHSNIVHPDVACDSCSPNEFVTMKGTRYACLVCYNFDLCESCEAKQHIDKSSIGGHSYKHPMAKITVPDAKFHRKSDYCLGSNNFTRVFGEGFDTFGDGCGSYSSAYAESKSHAYTHNNDLYVDIPMENCDEESKAKLLLYLEYGIAPFVENVSACIERSEKYQELLALVGDAFEDDEKFDYIKALIVSSEGMDVDDVDVDVEDVDELAESFSSLPIAPVADVVMEDVRSYRSTPEFELKEEPYHTFPPVSDLEELPIDALLKNAVSLTLKSTSGNSQVISLQLVNNSNLHIKGGKLTFDFLSSGNRQIIHIPNASDIKPNQTRFYNLGNLFEKFDTFDGVSVRLTTVDFVMAGDFDSRRAELSVFKSSYPFESVEKSFVFDPNTDLISDVVEYVDENSEITVSVIVKSTNLSQVTIQNNTNETLKCAGLKLSIVNHEGTTVNSVTIYKTYGILPGKSSKFNVALLKEHTDLPFRVYLKNEETVGFCELSKDNNMTGKLIFSGAEDSGTEEVTSSEAEDGAGEPSPCGTPLEVSDSIPTIESSVPALESSVPTLELSEPALSESNIRSVVLPSLPRESLSNSQVSTTNYVDAASDEVDDYEDYDIISDGETDNSDFEILSPVTSH